MTSAKNTQEPLSLHFYYWLESKRILQNSIIFLIIRRVPPTSHQTRWILENKRPYNFWVTWSEPNIFRNLYLYTSSIDQTLEHISRNPLILLGESFCWHENKRESSQKDKKATYAKRRFYSLQFASWICNELLHDKRWYYIQTSCVKALW